MTHEIDVGLELELSRVYGSQLRVLLDKLRTPPRRLYIRVNTMRTTREKIIELLREEDIVAYPDEYFDDAVYVTIEGPFKLECDTDKVIVVDEKTATSLLLGVDLYRPGILRSDYFVERDRLLAVTRDRIPVACIEAIVSYEQAYRMQKGLIGVNISSPYKAPSLISTKPYQMGLIYLQGAPSIATVHVLNPKPGELVVDMNASPGGKSSHIVQYTQGKARLISIDRSESKITQLKGNLARMGLDINVLAIPMDSRYVHLDLDLREKVDKILIDPPCSNLGVRPVIRFNRSMKEIDDLSRYQRQFIKAAYHILKPGGLLVYSTCTITLRENEENILYAVEEVGFHNIELDDPPSYSVKVVYKGIVGYRYSPLDNDMPGYFIAVLSK